MRRGQVADFLGKTISGLRLYENHGYLTPTKNDGEHRFDKDQVLNFALNPPHGVTLFIGKNRQELERRLNHICNGGKAREINPHKYSKRRFTEIYQGYDFLQYLGLVRYYITRKYAISPRDLEFILYLHPLRVFTYAKLSRYPKSFGLFTVSSLVKKGIIVRVSSPAISITGKKKYEKDKGTFMLTKEKVQMVAEFYELLAREKPFDTTHPAFNTGNSIDEKRVRLIKKMEKTSVNEDFKKLYK
jgi:hypothetical protein